MRNIRIAFTAALLLCVSVLASAQRQLTILHVNDTHSHIDPIATEGQIGGEIERAAFVDSVRLAEGRKNVLYLHAGDFSQGSSYFSILNGDLEIELLNAGGVDCVTLGNHEFDNGIEELSRRLSNLKAKAVCANYDFSGFELGKHIQPYTIIRRAGRKIGVIGMLCNIYAMVDYKVSSKIPRLGEDADIINKWADYLKNDQKCDLVIVLSHMGYERDMELIPETGNVDLFVGGHSHTLLSRPGRAQDKDAHLVRVVQDWCWGRCVGVLKLN